MVDGGDGGWECRFDVALKVEGGQGQDLVGRREEWIIPKRELWLCGSRLAKGFATALAETGLEPKTLCEKLAEAEGTYDVESQTGPVFLHSAQEPPVRHGTAWDLRE